MENKKIHSVIISILIISLVIFAVKRLSKVNQEITISSSSPDKLIQIGNCFSYHERGLFYGVILVKLEDNDLFTVALLDKISEQELKIEDFRDGSLICTRNEMLTPSGASGFYTGFFLKNELNVFKQNFKYIGNIDLDITNLEVNGGSNLIDNQSVVLKGLHDLNIEQLSKIKIIVYKMPVIKFMK